MTKINYLFTRLPLGEALIASDGEGVCYLSFTDSESDDNLAELKKIFDPEMPVYCQCDDSWINEAIIQLSKWTPDSHVNLSIRGTDFQKQVWEQLQKIPYGKITTYREIAIALGVPKAVRAVANAIGQNHIAMLIPCHRVVRTNGSLAGFRWGVERKKALLEEERAL